MRLKLKLVVLLVLALVAPSAFAAPNAILLLFNGNTEVNRHLYSYFGQTFSGRYKVTATLDPSSVKPGQYKAVIVVSTKTTTGIDPVLSKFIKAYPAPKELYLVSLLSRSNSFAVTPIAAASSPEGVDGVTAATTWSGGSQAMHQQWMRQLASDLSAK